MERFKRQKAVDLSWKMIHSCTTFSLIQNFTIEVLLPPFEYGNLVPAHLEAYTLPKVSTDPKKSLRTKLSNDAWLLAI